MFYAILVTAIPFAAEPPAVVDSCSESKDVAAMMHRASKFGERIQLAEVLFEGSAAMPAMPPELERGIAAWNTARIGSQIRGGRRYVPAYTKWCKRNQDRTYLLESVVAAAERRTEWHSWLTFGWLFGQKDGVQNSSKLMDSNGNGFTKQCRPVLSGDEFEAEER